MAKEPLDTHSNEKMTTSAARFSSKSSKKSEPLDSEPAQMSSARKAESASSLSARALRDHGVDDLLRQHELSAPLSDHLLSPFMQGTDHAGGTREDNASEGHNGAPLVVDNPLVPNHFLAAEADREGRDVRDSKIESLSKDLTTFAEHLELLTSHQITILKNLITIRRELNELHVGQLKSARSKKHKREPLENLPSVSDFPQPKKARKGPFDKKNIDSDK